MDSIRLWVEEHLSPERLEHTQRVVSLAKDLARHWNVDEEKAELAGLLHDCARDLSFEEMLAIIKKCGQSVDAYKNCKPAILHAPVAAELIQKELGITDEEVINAVRFHTTGRPEMGMLEKVIYLADYTEPARNFRGVNKVRKALYQDLDLALKNALDQTLIYVIKRGQIVCPNTLAARNYLYQQECSEKEE